MAEEAYGTFFPQNIGPLFTGELPGQNPVLAKIGRMYDDTSQIQTPDGIKPIGVAPRGPINLSPIGVSKPGDAVNIPMSSNSRLDELGPSYIPTGTDDDRDLYDLYKPDTRATEAYNALLKEMPVRPEPSVGTRILAGLSTLGQGGLKQAENVKYSRFNRAMTDWGTRADRLKDLAEMERYQNTNNRMILNSALTERRADRRQTEIERKNRENAEQAAARLRLQQWKVDNPDLPPPIRLGNGNYGIRDPKTNQIQDTGVKYGLSPLEDILMERESTRERQDTAARHATELQNQREAAAKALEDQRQQNRIELERLQALLKQMMETQRNLTPEQEKVRQFLVAQETFNTDPEAKPFLFVNEEGANTFTIKMPNTLPQWTSWGKEQKQKNAAKWIEINKKIYGQAWQPPKTIQDIAFPPGSKPAAAAKPAARPANVPAHYIKVTDGKEEGWIDPQEFDAKTMKKVQ